MFIASFRGDSITVQSDNICASAWMDRKIVMVMCSGVDPVKSSSVLRGQQDGSRLPVTCPTSCDIYNQYMGGVDLGDQLRGYYHLRMKCRKFYQYIAKFLLDVAITNSFILYHHSHPDSTAVILKFREVLGKQLTDGYCTRRRAAI